MIKKNLKEWEDLLPHVEFAYNRVVHSTTQMCPFEVVYSFKPITPLDLLPLPLQESANMDASKRAEYVKKIHLKTKQEIEKKSEYYAAKANKNRKKMIFQSGDLVWLHLRKDRFPEKQKSKWQPRGEGLFKVLTRINDNAYKLELPGDDYAVSNTFNVADLSPFFGLEGPESRSTLFQEGEDDEDIPNDVESPPRDYDSHYSEQESNVYKGPMNRARMRHL
jgi:hypothetical protein